MLGRLKLQEAAALKKAAKKEINLNEDDEEDGEDEEDEEDEEFEDDEGSDDDEPDAHNEKVITAKRAH